MSSNTPFEPEQGTDGAAEYLGTAPSAADKRPARSWTVLGAAAAGVVGVVALGSWGALNLLAGGGDQPAESIPSTAVGYVSLDLDPSASQKIEAFTILRKFPALKKELDLNSSDDLRRLVFDAMQKDGTCTDLDYAKDIEPWIGDRIAVAGAPVGGDLAPLVTLQVTDQEAADAGLRELFACGEPDTKVGIAFNGDYAMVSDTQKHADALASATAQGTLADDPTFQEWTAKVGDPGIVTMYAAPGAGEHLAEMMGGIPAGNWFAYSLSGQPDPVSEEVKALYKDFRGMAGVIRFADGAVEAEFAGDGMSAASNLPKGGSDSHVDELPASTAAAFAVALPDGWFDAWLDEMERMLPEGESMEDLMIEAERQTGLDLPQDIETLLGEGFAFAVDSDLDVDAMSSGDLNRIPVGLRITGNPSEILPVVDKIKAAIGPESEMLIVDSGDGVVALGVSPDYVGSLAKDGGLGGLLAFQAAVPDADVASGVGYVNFDSFDGLLDRLAKEMGPMGGETGMVENLKPLQALGFSSWLDEDGEQHGRFRLTTN